MKPRTISIVAVALTIASRLGIKGLYLGLLVLNFFAFAGIANAATLTCADLIHLVLPDTTIISAEIVPADPHEGLPEYCDVTGFTHSTVGFEIRLPIANWNGKLYFGGNGGFAGHIRFDTSYGLERNYATISTDTGHGNIFDGDTHDASWALNNRRAEIEFGYLAVHQTTVVGKWIIQSYYKRAPKFSYFDGCSNGGRQGLQEAQRYPADFNGIIVGAPALDMTGLNIGFNWDMQALKATESTGLIPLEKFDVIRNAILEECDAIDGIVDGLIDDPRKCHFRPETLKCASNDGPSCLTLEQVDALQKIYSGPKDSSGRNLYPGFPIGAESDSAWLVNSPDAPSPQFFYQDQFLRYLAFPNDNPTYDWKTFNFDKDPQRTAVMGRILNATDANLSGFHKLNGKLLMYQGWSDAAVTPARTIKYYQEVRKSLGGKDATETVRLFMAPGVFHCGGGPGPDSFDYLTALERWVEEGQRPESMEATHYDENGNIDRTRPLCPYPMVARYDGSGSKNKSANFHCEQPTQ